MKIVYEQGWIQKSPVGGGGRVEFPMGYWLWMGVLFQTKYVVNHIFNWDICG